MSLFNNRFSTSRSFSRQNGFNVPNVNRRDSEKEKRSLTEGSVQQQRNRTKSNRGKKNVEEEKELLLRNYDTKKVDAIRKRNKYAPYDIAEEIIIPEDGNFLLQETGDFVLLEDGNKIIVD